MEIKPLARKLQKLLKKNKEIIDLVIFGSLVKGSSKPSDLDIAIIVNDEKINRLSVKKEIEAITRLRVDLQWITIQHYETKLWITLIREGFSVKHQKFLFEHYGIRPVSLYKYTLKQLTPSKKVMFERALRNFKGIERLSNRVILVPTKISAEFSNFLRQWEIDIDTEEYGLLPLMRKTEM